MPHIICKVKTGLIEYDSFLDVMVGKMQNARNNYNDTVPFTVMSKYVLDKYKKNMPMFMKKELLLECV